MEKSLGEIMHGLSEENIAREEELFENMPVFPRISRSKNLTMLLVHRVKSCIPVPKGCDILAEGLYVDENYTYRRSFLHTHPRNIPSINIKAILISISFSSL